MPRPKYIGIPHPKALNNRRLNVINGSDAEVYAGAALIMATGGEISWGSREEDGCKIDLLLSFPNQWGPRGRRIVLAQVKSGKTYGKAIEEKEGLKVILYQRIFEDSFTTTNDILLLWVGRKQNYCYWTYVIRGQKPSLKELSGFYEVGPALRYDLARTIGSREKLGGKGLNFPLKELNFKELRVAAKIAYDGFKMRDIVSPLFGPVEFTKSGWRHMCRASRHKDFKYASWQIIPYLPTIIKTEPDYHLVQIFNRYDEEDWSYRESVYILVYNEVQCQIGNEKPVPKTVYLKIEELIVWPINWQWEVQRGQLVQRRCKLLSVYHKSMEDKKDEKKEPGL